MALVTYQPPCAKLLRPRATCTRAAARPVTARPAHGTPAPMQRPTQPTQLRARRGLEARAAGGSDSTVSNVLAEVTDTSRLGSRGEWLCVHSALSCFCGLGFAPHACGAPSFAAQVAAIAAVVFPPGELETLSGLLGTSAMGGGLVFLVAGATALGGSLSPFPVPSKAGHALKTDGVFAQVRHPMYTGLLLSSFGLSLASGSFARLLFTAALAWVLNTKADVEERSLEELYPADYVQYKAAVPRIVPNVPLLTPAVKTLLGALGSAASSAAAAVEDDS